MDFCLSSCMRSCSMRRASSLVSGVCVCVCVSVYIYTYMCTHTHVDNYICIHIHIPTCIHICRHAASGARQGGSCRAERAHRRQAHRIDMRSSKPRTDCCRLSCRWVLAVNTRTCKGRGRSSRLGRQHLELAHHKLAAAALRTCTPRQQQRTCDRRRSISSSARINLSLVAASRASHSSLKSMISI